MPGTSSVSHSASIDVRSRMYSFVVYKSSLKRTHGARFEKSAEDG